MDRKDENNISHSEGGNRKRDNRNSTHTKVNQINYNPSQHVGRCGCDCLVVGFITPDAISAYYY